MKEFISMLMCVRKEKKMCLVLVVYCGLIVRYVCEDVNLVDIFNLNK